MLTITIPEGHLFDEENQIFIDTKETTLQLEHSLISVSKWESKWKKSFLSNPDKSAEEVVDYIRCMTVNQNVDPNVYLVVTGSIMNEVNEYINDTMTATFFSERKGQNGYKKEIITSEVIYYWMIAQNIPMECQKWHLNRLLTLIKVCSIKNTPPEKRSKQNKSDMLAERAALNAKRKAALHSNG